MPTIVLRSVMESSESLARRLLSEFESSWSITNSDVRYVSVAGGATVSLSPYATYVVSADPVSTVVVGWTFNSNTVEVPVNGVTVVTPPATPYLRNPAASTTVPVPCKVLAFT